MAVLSDTDRARTAAQWMRARLNSIAFTLGNCAFTKADVRAAVDATDAWIDGNAGASSTNTGFNSALPTAFRNAASTQQKTLLFCFVSLRRAGLLQAEED